MRENAPLKSGDPARLGGYELRARLGEGGQGVVYLGVSPSGRPVAIKWLRSDLAEDPVMRERFLREVASAQRVAAFCTAQIIETGIEQDRPYIVSEYIDGPSLQQLVARQGPLSGSALQRLAIGTATALAAIHRAGIVHRDFKPANVLMGPDGPRVIDFGIAKALDAAATLSSRPIGTPSYMAPEQLTGTVVGPPADLFAWAGTIVYAATGDAPFGSDSVPAVINRILNASPQLGGLDPALRDLVAACLAKDPTARPTAEQVLLRQLQQPAPEAGVLQQAAAAAALPLPAAPGGPAGNSVPPAWPAASGHPPPAGASFPGPSVSGPLPQAPWSPSPAPYAPPPIRPRGPEPQERPPRRTGKVIMIAAAVVAVLVAAAAAVLVLRPHGESATAARPRPSGTPSAAPSPTGVVPTSGLTATRLPGVAATIYEHPDDPVALTYYQVWDAERKAWINYPRDSRTGPFTRSTKYWQMSISPDGRLASGRTKQYNSAGLHPIEIIDRRTGEVTAVDTVRKPHTYDWPDWSADSSRLLLSMRTPAGQDGESWTTTGFIVVDVRAGTAKNVPIRDPAIRDGRFYWAGGHTVATAFTTDGRTGLRFYDLNGTVLRELPGVGAPYHTTTSLFSPAGRSFVTKCPGAEEDVCVWDAASGRRVTRFSSRCIKILGWFDEGHLFCWTAGAADRNRVTVVDLTGRPLRTLLTTTQADALGPHYTRVAPS